MKRAGQMNKRIIIQQVALVPSSTGAPQETWSTFATVWANVEPLRGRMLFAAQSVHPETTTRITIRYLSGLTPKHRILYGTRIFLQTQPPMNVEERNREITLLCKEVF